jgi:hypothetical protein
MELTACRMQSLAAQRRRNQPEVGYIPLPPFWYDMLLWYCWEHKPDGKQSGNQDDFNIFGIEYACCIVDKVPPWRLSAFSTWKVETARACKLSNKMMFWTRDGFSPQKDEQHCFNRALPWTAAHNCNKVVLPTLVFRSELAGCSVNTSGMFDIQLEPIQLGGLNTCRPTSGIKQWEVQWNKRRLRIQYGYQLEV